MMLLVDYRIQALRAEVIHIPGGWTSLCELVNTRFNKPFKDPVLRMWMEWMVAEGLKTGTMPAPLRRDVAGWVDTVMKDMVSKRTMMMNVWVKTNCKWF